MAKKKVLHACKYCKYLHRVHCHPFNAGPSNGPINKLFGYACTGLDHSEGCTDSWIFYDIATVDRDAISAATNLDGAGCEIFTPRTGKAK